MKALVRRKIGNKLYEVTKGYHDLIPLNDINNVLKEHGYQLLQEDKTPWSGFLCGADSNCLFDIGDDKGSRLWLSWYKMPRSGRYEIVCYLTQEDEIRQ